MLVQSSHLFYWALPWRLPSCLAPLSVGGALLPFSIGRASAGKVALDHWLGGFDHLLNSFWRWLGSGMPVRAIGVGANAQQILV